MSVPCLFVSPHLDDAVLGCGERIAAAAPHALVVTVFAGAPERDVSTPWDAASGFASSSAAMRARRDEDRKALACLGARALHLRFLDAQYGATPTVGGLADALSATIVDTHARVVFAPLGLFHSDHRLVSDACLSLAARRVHAVEWALYEDALYRRIEGAPQARCREVAARGFELEPVAGASCEEADRASHARAHAAKRRAIACYRSQLRALATRGRPGHRDALAPERHLRVAVVDSEISA